MSAHLEADKEPLVAAGQAQCPEKHRQGHNKKKGLRKFNAPVSFVAGMHAAECQHSGLCPGSRRQKFEVQPHLSAEIFDWLILQVFWAASSAPQECVISAEVSSLSGNCQSCYGHWPGELQ